MRNAKRKPAMPRKLLSSLIAAALALGAALPAAAEAAKIRTADLNLDSDAGARVALARIHQAARTVCGDEPDAHQLQRQALYSTCIRDAMDRTVAQAHSARLTALNNGPARETTVASAR